MKQIDRRPPRTWLALLCGLILLSAMDLRPQAGIGVTLSNAGFQGLTRIVVTTNVQLTGIAATHIVITRQDGVVIPPAKITGIDTSAGNLSVAIDADQFARITSRGTTIATKAFGAFRASRAVKIQKWGEYVDRDNKPHYVATALTAGNDMFRWGYRWLIHESGHAFGFPDLYMYSPTVRGVRVGQFFYCGGWDMMGNIAGHSTDYLAWHKWKLRWIRDDQVDVVSQSSANPTTHFITPVEIPGGGKMVVIRIGLSTAYVVEFRTRLGVDALDGRGKYSGVLIYRIDASRWESKDTNPTAQIISKQYYNNPAVGAQKNLTGVWRPIDNTVSGYDSPDCTWQPGDTFADPAAGVSIRVDSITHCNPSDPNNSPYTADTVATLTVTKTMSAALFTGVVLSDAQLKELTNLTFATNVELQQRIPNANAANRGTYTYIREDSLLNPRNLVITKANGSVIPARNIVRIMVDPAGVQVTLARGTFASAADAAGATVATKAYYQFGPGAAVPIHVAK